MISKKLLALDMSTTCTGWAVFDIETKDLLEYGYLKPVVPGKSKMKSPEKPYKTCKNMAKQIFEVYSKLNDVEIVAIEEVNKHKNRIAGKTLDALHAFIWDEFREHLKLLYYCDSDGSSGWRTHLGLKLSDADKIHNKEAKKLNKELAKGTTKIPVINKKHLACRYANKRYGLNLDCDQLTSDGDMADAIGLGSAVLEKVK